MLLSALLLILAQDPAELVEKLRSDDIEERDQAAKKLEALGKTAVTALRDAAKAWDAETGARAKRILRLIEVAEALTPAFRNAIPGAVARIANDQAFEVLSDALCPHESGAPRHPFLRGRDLGPAAAFALIDAKNDTQRMKICNLIKFHGPVTGAVVTELVKCLASKDEPLRSNAAHTLGCLDAHEAIPALIAALRDPSDGLVQEAATALATLEAVEAGTALLETLPRGRPGVVWSIVRLRVPGAVERLAALLEKPASDSAALLRALRILEGTDALDLLVQHKNPDVRLGALRELAVLDSKKAQVHADRLMASADAVERLTAVPYTGPGAARAALRDADPAVRDAGMLRLAFLLGSAAGTDLLPLLDKPPLTPALLRALAQADARTAIPRLAKLLQSDDLRDPALIALEQMRAPEAIPELVRRVRLGPDLVWGSDMTPQVARRIVAVGGETARKALQALAADESVYFRLLGVTFLGELGGADADLITHVRDEDVEVRAAAIAALANSEAGADAVAKRANDESPYVRAAVAAAARSPETVRPLLKDANFTVREAAAEALGRLRAKGAIPDLRALLADAQPGPRRGALRSLVQVAGRDAIPDALAMLGDATPWARVEALYALVELDAREALPAIEKLLVDPHGGVHQSAAAALVKLGSRAGVELLLDTAEPFQGTGSLFGFNRLRQPDAWNRLAKTAVPPRRRAPLRERLTALAAAAGLTLEISIRVDGAETEDGRVSDGTSYWDAVERELPLHIGVILEADRLRVVSRREAVKFWRAWASK